MNISILSVFPELYTPFLSTSLLARAQEQHLLSFDACSFFQVASPKERIDAPSYGPGAGMLITPHIVEQSIVRLEEKHGPALKIFFSPHGKVLDQQNLKRIFTRAQESKHVMLVAGRYEGMDERVERVYADEIISLGNFVMMGGDIPALAFIESFARLVPGVVGKQESVERDSFTGPFVDYPEYTQPLEWHGLRVPDVVRSGNHQEIALWRKKEAIKRTLAGHFDWLRTYELSSEDKSMVRSAMPRHYAVLVHSGVMLPDGKEGTTSVTSFDIHDGARSAATYGLSGYYIVTPLLDQQRVVQTLIDFWKEGVGVTYNPHRHEAMQLVSLHNTLEQVLSLIEEKEGVRPLLVATSACNHEHKNIISFFDQDIVWQQKRPVLFLFGTGKGISDRVLQLCDYVLAPIEGLTDFNHLSVRCAMAIVYDRWLGMQPSKKSI
jgi:tRNA (guanine37-N1)-methyltransferase